MRLTRRSMRVVTLVLPTVIVLLAVSLTTSIAIAVQAHSIRSATEERVRDVAVALAAHELVQATLSQLATEDSASVRALATEQLQPLASLVERTAGVDFVVITDASGKRLTHPTPELRGQHVSTELGPVLEGHEFLGTEVGTLGPTLRAKVAVTDGSHPTGALSVGILESRMAEDHGDALAQLLPWAIGALVCATLTSSLLSAALERRWRRHQETKREFASVQRTATALREQTHEFHTRLHVIHGLVSHGDTQDALDYIDSHTPVLRGDTETDAEEQALLRATFDAVRSELAAMGARLETEFSLTREVDQHVLFVLTNLCRNAGEAGATVVRCSLSQVGGQLYGTVEDNGPGIAAHQAERVFERGFTTKPDPTGVGRGIGLDMVRRTVTSRGGTIELSRSPLGGARFQFEMGWQGAE